MDQEMAETEFGEAIAKRELNQHTPIETQSLTIEIGKPRLSTKPGGDWECPIKIGEKVKLAYGVDSYQALSLALQLISIEVKYLKDQQNMELTWLEMQDLGLEPIRE